MVTIACSSVGRIKYYPYGSTRSSIGSLYTDKKFTGQRLDSTGLYYYGARYYDPTIGRFISADSIVPDPRNPQLFNRYSYCLNNPLKYIDPSGSINVATDECSQQYVDYMVSCGFNCPPGAFSSTQNVVPVPYGTSPVSNGSSINLWTIFMGAVGVAAIDVPPVAIIAAIGTVILAAITNQSQSIIQPDVGSPMPPNGPDDFQDGNFRRNLVKLTGEDPKGYDAHHIFPKQFNDYFSRSNININVNDPQYGTWWQMNSHRQNAFYYNEQWRGFLATGPTREQCLQFGADLSKKYGLNIYFVP